GGGGGRGGRAGFLRPRRAGGADGRPHGTLRGGERAGGGGTGVFRAATAFPAGAAGNPGRSCKFDFAAPLRQMKLLLLRSKWPSRTPTSHLAAGGSWTYCRLPRSDLFGSVRPNSSWPVEPRDVDARDRFCCNI